MIFLLPYHESWHSLFLPLKCCKKIPSPFPSVFVSVLIGEVLKTNAAAGLVLSGLLLLLLLGRCCPSIGKLGTFIINYCKKIILPSQQSRVGNNLFMATQFIIILYLKIFKIFYLGINQNSFKKKFGRILYNYWKRRSRNNEEQKPVAACIFVYTFTLYVGTLMVSHFHG